MKTLFYSFIHCYVFTGRQSGRALTLPDSSAVDVDLHGVGGVERLVIVEDEDVTTQGVDPGRVHRCILGKAEVEQRQSDIIQFIFTV